MAETGFKHIAVTAAEEDDFVIRAGVSDQHEPEPEPEPEEQEEAESADSAEMVVDEKTDTYHETTLEDLNSTQMPLAQKIVIAAAIVCIIGAVIYYFAFLR